MSPAVTMVVTVHDKPWDLLVTLASLKVQTLADFECIVIHEPSSMLDESKKIAESLDDRFSFRPYRQRVNDWGNTAKLWGAGYANSAIVGFANADVWYAPKYLEWMSAPILRDDADFAYCNIVSHYTDYRPVDTAPEPGRIDGIGWLCRRNTVLSTPMDSSCSPLADSEYAMKLSKRSRVAKIQAILAVAN